MEQIRFFVVKMFSNLSLIYFHMKTVLDETFWKYLAACEQIKNYCYRTIVKDIYGR